jgi:aminoglycoside 6-adenylyltransferase
MRNEREMLDLILNWAKNDDNVRAVVMNGSRVNPNAPQDRFQDFDVVYFVRDVEAFKQRPNIVSYFGDIMILQTPEDMGDPPPENDGHYTYLMQFRDGTRIDLSLDPVNMINKIVSDSLSRVLLDKDQGIPGLLPPSDRDYLPHPPNAKAYADCCNEFWWLNPYVAKGLWRDELTYAHYFFDSLLRPQFMKMLTWYFGIRTNFQKSPGKCGKYLKQGIEPELWERLERTYADAHPEHIWDALFVMDDLFRDLAHLVAQAFGFIYPEQDDRNVTQYIRQIRQLPNKDSAQNS